MNIKTQENLLEVIQNQETYGEIGDYFREQKLTGKNLSSKSDLNLINTCILKQGLPSFTKESSITLPYTLWDKSKVELHNKYLQNQQNYRTNNCYIEDCDSYIVLCNNTKDKNKNDFYAIIDVDCIEELWKLYENGFPCLTCPYTLSRNKKLPHYFIRSDMEIKRQLGKNLPIKREIDLITISYEKHHNEIRGSNDLPLITTEELQNYMGQDFLIQEEKSFEVRLDNKIKQITNAPAQVIQIPNKKGKTILDIDLGSKILEPKWEVLSLYQIQRILKALPVEEYEDLTKYFSICKSVISMLTPLSNPMDYVITIDEFYKQSKNYDTKKGQYFCWLDETIQNFVKLVNNKEYEGLRKPYLLKQLRLHKLYELWRDIAFDENQDINPEETTELNSKEIIEVLNKKIGWIAGGRSEGVCFDPNTSEFFFKSKGQLENDFANIYYKGEEQFDKKGKSLGFPYPNAFNLWFKSPKRKQYNGGVVFQPNTEKVKLNQFNLFNGFECEKHKELMEEVGKLSKEELEEELKLILKHLHYLGGEEKVEEMYEFQLKYFAHLLKYPWILPKVWGIWVSLQGCGKNIFLSFIAKIIGEKYYYSTEHLASMFGNFNERMRGKLLYNVNEMKNAHQYEHSMKAFITEEKVDTKQKCKDNLEVNNYGRGIASTQLINSCCIEFGDRRYWVVRCNPITISDEFTENKYFKNLAKALGSKRLQCAFLHYCQNYVEVEEQYDFKNNRVITTEYRQVQQANLPPMVNYIIEFYSQYKNLTCKYKTFTVDTLYTFYEKFFEGNNENFTYPKSQFKTEFKSYVITNTSQQWLKNNTMAMFSKKHTEGSKKAILYDLDIGRCKAYLKKNDLDCNMLFAEDSDSECESECESDSEEDE